MKDPKVWIVILTVVFSTGLVVQQVRSNTIKASNGVTHDQLEAALAKRDTKRAEREAEMLRRIDKGFSDIRLVIARFHPRKQLR